MGLRSTRTWLTLSVLILFFCIAFAAPSSSSLSSSTTSSQNSSTVAASATASSSVLSTQQSSPSATASAAVSTVEVAKPSFTVEVGVINNIAASLVQNDIAVYVDPELWNTAVLCWYPVSGNYARTPRIVFYALLAFALLWRGHEWLIGGALAAALTYSGTAAIHACLLVWSNQNFADNDFWALLAILSTSCLIIVPLLNWSRTLRHLGARPGHKSAARTIIIYWAFLVAMGFLCLFVALNDPGIFLVPFDYSSLLNTTCVPPNGQLSMTAGQDSSWTALFMDAEWIAENNCIDPCFNVAELDGPTIFRDNSDLRTLTQVEIRHILGGPKVTQKESRNAQYSAFYINYGLASLVYILAQGVWTACFGRRSPRQVRDVLFLSLYGIKVPWLTTDRARQHGPARFERFKRWQKWYAVTVAFCAYLWAIFATVLALPLFVGNMVANEIIVNQLPEAESHIHVGAWSSPASVGLVVFAAFVGRYHDSLVNTVIRIFNQGLYRVSHAIHEIQRKRATRRRNQLQDTEKGSRPTIEQAGRKVSVAPYPHALRRTGYVCQQNINAMLKSIQKMFRHGRVNVREEWASVRSFLKSPEQTVFYVPRHPIDKHGGHGANSIDALIMQLHSEKFTFDLMGMPTAARVQSQKKLEKLNDLRNAKAQGDLSTIRSSWSGSGEVLQAETDNPELGQSINSPGSHEHIDLDLVPGSHRIEEIRDRFGVSHRSHIAPPMAAPLPRSSPSTTGSVEDLPPPVPEKQVMPTSVSGKGTIQRRPVAGSVLGTPNPEHDRKQAPKVKGSAPSLNETTAERTQRSDAQSPELSPNTRPNPTGSPTSPAAPTPGVSHSRIWHAPLSSDPELQHLLTPMTSAPTLSPESNSEFSPLLSQSSYPRPAGGDRAGRSYLEVARVATEPLGDEIRLRKGDDGLYHIIED